MPSYISRSGFPACLIRLRELVAACKGKRVVVFGDLMQTQGLGIGGTVEASKRGPRARQRVHVKLPLQDLRHDDVWRQVSVDNDSDRLC